MRIRPSKHTGEVVMEVNRRDEPLLTEAVATPFRLKKILVPTDFSDCSKKAIQYALPLAQQHHAEIVLLYVAPSPSYAGGEYGVIDCSALNAELCATGEKRLEALVAEAIQNKVSAETVVRTGSATAEIIDVATNLPADMIVISCLMINFILETFHLKKLRVSTYSLKEGALLDYIHHLKK